jgi:hypothetical protein
VALRGAGAVPDREETMAYILATLGTQVRWYVFKLDGPGGISSLQKGEFDLIEHLDLEVVPGFANKESAKMAATAVGLSNWRYVKLDGPKKVYTWDIRTAPTTP